MDRELNFICSVTSLTPGCVDYSLLKSAGTTSSYVFINLVLCSQAGVPKWWRGGNSVGGGDMKETVDIYCFMSQSELWEFLVADMQSNVVHTPMILFESGDTNDSDIKHVWLKYV